MSEAPVEAVPVLEQSVPPVAVVEPAFKVFAGNLSYSTKEEQLREFFEPLADEIVAVQIIMRGPRPAGYGFVSLKTAEAAEKAVELFNKKELEGREVLVEVAKPIEAKEKGERKPKTRKPGRRGAKAVQGEVTDAEANGEAVKPAEDGAAAAEGGADEAAKPKKKKKKSAKKPKSKAAEEGAEGEVAATEGESAVEGGEATKKAPKPKRAKKPARPAGEDPVGEPSKTMLFVANLGFNTDDAALAAIFTEASITVVSARVVRRRWGQPRRSKGYGFVEVSGPEDQQAAITALEGKEVDGRVIAVKIAVDTPKEDEVEETKPVDGADAEPSSVVVAA